LRSLARLARLGIPVSLIAVIVFPRSSLLVRSIAAGLIVSFWTAVYVRYRRGALRETRREWELLRSTSWNAFWRHYNERVPTVEEEYELWGPYHKHRHEMRYDIVAAEARKHIEQNSRVLDLGCGSANVADRLGDLPFRYVGMDFGGPAVRYAQEKYRDRTGPMRSDFVLGDGEYLPLTSESMDVVVMSEVIEHLLRPEIAVWEIARVLRPGGVFVMSTNNASEAPLRSPVSHLFVWFEKALGAHFPSLISLRPWTWPEKIYRDLLPEGSPDVYLPHTHHIQRQTRRMFAAAGLDTFTWSTFEFPPPQSRTAAWLESRRDLGLRLVDAIEWVAQHLPAVRHLGTHLFMAARKTGIPVAPYPPAGVWPGPASESSQP
jgi:ubiquinone/menaquinone biosynthesis C-methylase UbiE